MSSECNCCGHVLPTGRVAELGQVQHLLPHARFTLYAYDRLDRDGKGIEWLYLRRTVKGDRLMIDLALAAQWYQRKWPRVARTLRELATASADTITAEVADR